MRVRLERLLGLLSKYNPDIVCLQELKCTDDFFPSHVLTGMGYHTSVFGQKTYNGVAILSKTKPEEVHKGFADGEEDSHARYIQANLGNLSVASVYVPNGQAVGSEKYDYKLRWLNRFHHYLRTSSKSHPNILLAGDFNITPEDIDVHDPALWNGKVLCSEPERQAIRQLVECGFIDIFRKHNKEGGWYSWWDYRQLAFPKNQGLRIDLILASYPFCEGSTSCWIDREERKGTLPSDHAPVIADFD